MNSQPRTAVCTICSANYLAQVRVLMESFEAIHPDWDRHLLLVDEIDGRFEPSLENFDVTEVRELPLPDSKRFFFRYTILELNTAVKPFFLRWLAQDKGYDRVLYIDPDIRAYSELTEVEEAFDAGALMCLTPHLTAPLPDERKPNELDILRAGTHNLGFIALAQHPSLLPFLDWWAEKTVEHCVVDFAAHLFVDQRWIDLVPGMFPDVKLIRHPGYNIAYWNLPHRDVEKVGSQFRVNGEPLVFFHYSGLDPLNLAPLSKHQDRYTYATLGAERELIDDYRDRILALGYSECREWPYAYRCFDDGVEIAEEARRMYRESDELRDLGGDDPFEMGAAPYNEPAGPKGRTPLVTKLMLFIWERRPEVAKHFPDPLATTRFEFAQWFVHEFVKLEKIDSSYVEPVRASLAEGAPPKGSLGNRLGGRVRRWLRRLNPISRRLPEGLKAPLKFLLTAALPPVAVAPAPTRNRSFGVKYAGFHPMGEAERDEGYAWMGPHASVRLTADSNQAILIEGEHHADLLQRATGSPVLDLSVAVDNTVIGEIRLERAGRFSEKVAFDGPVGANSELTLQASGSFVPGVLGHGADPRELSIRIRQISIGETRLLDFSASGDPYRLRVGEDERPGLNIVGYVRSELGVGESSRLCAASARAARIPFALVDFSAGCTSRTNDDRWVGELAGDNPHSVNLLHVNADQVPLLAESLGAEFFHGKYNIGVWHWELPDFPDEWLGSFDLLDEIWAPSRFVMESISEKSPHPTVLMPHAIDFPVPGPERAQRTRFGLPEDRFLFLTMYDMHSFQARKNPEASLEAFAKAFPDPDRDGVGLVIKLMNGGTYPEDYAALKERLASAPGVHLIDGTLSRQEVYELEACCDAFVSLHRSEGFGLGLAECMFLGKPVVGTNWSGNVDFMTSANSCPVDYRLIELDHDYGPYRAGQHWADPDVEHASHYLRKLATDEAFRKRIGRAGQQTILTQNSPEAIGDRYERRLRVIAQML